MRSFGLLLLLPLLISFDSAAQRVPRFGWGKPKPPEQPTRMAGQIESIQQFDPQDSTRIRPILEQGLDEWVEYFAKFKSFDEIPAGIVDLFLSDIVRETSSKFANAYLIGATREKLDSSRWGRGKRRMLAIIASRLRVFVQNEAPEYLSYTLSMSELRREPEGLGERGPSLPWEFGVINAEDAAPEAGLCIDRLWLFRRLK